MNIENFNYADYKNFEDFLNFIKLKTLEKDKNFEINIYSTEKDILSYQEFSDHAYSNLSKIYSLFNSKGKILNFIIHTRIPKTIEARSFKDIFHNIPVEIKYYITEHKHINNTSFLNMPMGIKKLNDWAIKNPFKSNIFIDIDSQSKNFKEFESLVLKSYIPISKVYIQDFCLN